MNKTERNGAGAAPRRAYDETYKRHAVALTLQSGRTVKDVAAELGIAVWALYEWRRLYAPPVGVGGPAPRTLAEAEEEIGRLRAEVVRLREREVVLKKSLGILSETPGSGMCSRPDSGRREAGVWAGMTVVASRPDTMAIGSSRPVRYAALSGCGPRVMRRMMTN